MFRSEETFQKKRTCRRYLGTNISVNAKTLEAAMSTEVFTHRVRRRSILLSPRERCDKCMVVNHEIRHHPSQDAQQLVTTMSHYKSTSSSATSSAGSWDSIYSWLETIPTSVPESQASSDPESSSRRHKRKRVHSMSRTRSPTKRPRRDTQSETGLDTALTRAARPLGLDLRQLPVLSPTPSVTNTSGRDSTAAPSRQSSPVREQRQVCRYAEPALLFSPASLTGNDVLPEAVKELLDHARTYGVGIIPRSWKVRDPTITCSLTRSSALVAISL